MRKKKSHRKDRCAALLQHTMDNLLWMLFRQLICSGCCFAEFMHRMHELDPYISNLVLHSFLTACCHNGSTLQVRMLQGRFDPHTHATPNAPNEASLTVAFKSPWFKIVRTYMFVCPNSGDSKFRFETGPRRRHIRF
jgi:hypothetical protein